jgi:hypothetical protein
MDEEPPSTVAVHIVTSPDPHTLELTPRIMKSRLVKPISGCFVVLETFAK